MGYRIVYGRKKRQFCQLTKGKKVLAAAIVICVLLVMVCFLGGTEFLLPGDREISGAALENMVNAVRNGENISDAVASFCREIILNAQMPH